jgi:hypothetical protein
MGDMSNAYKILVGKAEEKPRGRLWHRWENNIKIDLSLTGFGGVDFIHLTWNRTCCPCVRGN